MRHVILEGPDGAGKTTLAKQFCKQQDLAYHHEGPPPSGTESLLNHYASLLVNAAQPTVFDRFHLGELVYGPLLRGKSRLDGMEVLLMNRLLHATGSIVLGCLPQFETCLRNTRSKEELIKDERLLAIAYKQWQLLFHAKHILVNGDVYDYESLPPLFIKPTVACEPVATGSPVAKFLFVGERATGALDLPFFSACYFNTAIADAGFVESEVAFTNAQYPSTRERNLARIVLGFPRALTVVALGQVAERALKDQRVQHMSSVNCMKQVPHPTFWKQSHEAEQSAYVEMLKEIRHAAQ